MLYRGNERAACMSSVQCAQASATPSEYTISHVSSRSWCAMRVQCIVNCIDKTTGTIEYGMYPMFTLALSCYIVEQPISKLSRKSKNKSQSPIALGAHTTVPTIKENNAQH